MDAKSQASSLRSKKHDYFAVYSSLIYYLWPVWRVLYHVCLSYDILQLDLIALFWKIEPSACQIFFSQRMDSASTKHECTCMRMPYMHETTHMYHSSIYVLHSVFLNCKNQSNLCSELSCYNSNY